MADLFYCLNIGENLIKVADAKNLSNQLEIQSMGFVESELNFFSNDSEKINENQSEKISKLVGSLKITKKNIAIVIPDSVTYSQILEMPRLNEKELISAIKYQADQFIPMPIEETNIDLEILSETEKDNKILVLMVAAQKRTIEKIQRVTELAGLIPESIENELSVTARFLSSFYKVLYPNIQDGVIVINLAYNSTSLYYFNPQTSLTMQSHTFNIGYSLFLKELQINLNTDIRKSIEILTLYQGQETTSVSVESVILPLLKEFTFEVKRFINLISEKYQTSIKQISVVNDGYRFIYLPKYLQNSFSITTELLNPYSIIKKTSVADQNKNTMALFVPTIGGNLR
jgi:type IV pilus assembly protein PilM